MNTPSIAYLAEGHLYLRGPDGKVTQVQSAYAKGLMEQAERAAEKNAWRYKSADMGMPLWGVNGKPGGAGESTISFCAVTRSEPGKLLYSLDTGSTSGLFVYETDTGEERRLVHRRQMRAQGLHRHGADGTIACSTGQQNGSEHLALMNADGSRLREITDGDVLDQAPAWVPTEKETLLYQSAGLSRSQQGFVMAVGPYAVLKLNLTTGNLDPILESPHTDYLLPKQDVAGNLYYIARPYESPRHHTTLMDTVKDILLFPVRLVVAIYFLLYGLINLVSAMRNQQPPKWAGGPGNTPAQPNRAIMLYGRYIDAQKAAANNTKSEAPGLVPKTWRLLKRDPSGKDTTLAEGVLSFDLCDAGIVYTDGRRVKFLDNNGETQTLAKGELIEHVTVTN
jgi:hypothetical protein